MTTKKPFVGFNIDEDLMNRIDDFRFNNRITSRAKALEIILRAGMKAMAEEYPELDVGTKLETGKKQKDDVVIANEKRIHL